MHAILARLRRLWCRHRWQEVWWSPFFIDCGLTKLWAYKCASCSKYIHRHKPLPHPVERLQRRSLSH